MRRLPLILGLALLLAVSAYLWGDRSEPESAEGTAPARSSAPVEVEPEALQEFADSEALLSAGESPRASESARVAEQGRAETEIEAADPEPASWEGRVELLRPDGTLLEDLDGSFRFMLWRGNSGRSELVEVSAGRFEFPVENGESEGELPAIGIQPEFGTFGALHGGPWVDPNVPAAERERNVPWQRGELAVVRLRELAPVVLHVHDADTGQPLGNVDLVLASDHYGWGDPEPLPGVEPELWRAGVAVPLELSFDQLPKQALRSLKLPLQVGAEGYAWRGVKLSLGQPEAHVGLAPGGNLEIQVTGMPDVNGLKLTLNGGEHLGTWPLRENGLLRFEGVPAGRVRAQVHRSEWYSIDKAFADAAVDVVAGETAAMDLPIDPAAGNPVRVFDVELLVAVPEEWEAESYSGLLDLVESPAGGGAMEGARFTPAGTEGGWTLFRSQEIELQEGVWALDGRDIPWRCSFPVEADGEIRLEVPAPAVTRVRVVDQRTGAAPEDIEVNWHGIVEGRGMGYSLHSAEPTEAAGEFLMRTPRGPLSVSVRCPSHFGDHRDLEPSELGGVLTVELERAEGVVLRLGDEQGEVPNVQGFWDL
ncbi:MAG: hypothetical protein ACYS26_10890, partial [Planctomycetota bacterium]